MQWLEDSLHEQPTPQHAGQDSKSSFLTPRRARPESIEQLNVPPRVMVLRRSLNPHSKEEEISTLELEDRKIDCQLHLVQEFPLQQHLNRGLVQSTRQIPKDSQRAGEGEQLERRRGDRSDRPNRPQTTPDRRTQTSQRWWPHLGAGNATPKTHLMTPG